MNALREGLPALPLRMRSLPVDSRGYPVPYFATWVNGTPDFKNVNQTNLLKCVKYRRCWICGEPLGRRATFVLGPLGAATRTNGEPPMHFDCAHFAVRACPFMVLPKAKKQLTADNKSLLELDRNPGVAVLYSIDRWQVSSAGTTLLFQWDGDPVRLAFYAEGREATFNEVAESTRTGMIEVEARMPSRDPESRFKLNTAVSAFLMLARTAIEQDGFIR